MRLEDIAKGVGPTEKLYLLDSYLRSTETKVLRVEPDEKNHFYFVSSETLFHPKSGGQPSDKGKIRSNAFEADVKKAMACGEVIIHWAKISTGKPSEGPATMEIDWNWRYLLMKRHTAGHLLDHCLTKKTGTWVETTDSWLGDDCYVGYRGTLPSSEQLRDAENLANEMIGHGARVSWEYVSQDRITELAAKAPNLLRLPKLSRYRLVSINGCEPIPCGGTHLLDVQEIGHLKVLEAKKSVQGFNLYFEVG